MRNRKFASRLLKIFVVFVFLTAFLVVFFKSAYYVRAQLLREYETGIYYYENGDYLEASKIFLELRGWGERLVEIPPEEYYSMALDRLKNTTPEVIVCPNCGEVVKTGVAVE